MYARTYYINIQARIRGLTGKRVSMTITDARKGPAFQCPPVGIATYSPSPTDPEQTTIFFILLTNYDILRRKITIFAQTKQSFCV